MNWLIILGIIYFTLMVVILLVKRVKGRQLLKSRIDELSDTVTPVLPSKKKGKEKGRQNLVSRILNRLGKYLTPKEIAKKIQLELQRADLPLKANEFIAGVFFTTVVSGSIAGIILNNRVLATVIGLVGFYFPLLFLKLKFKARQKAFNNQLLDTLLMMSSSLKAGYSFQQAMELVAQEGQPPTSDEFRRVIKETSLGRNLDDALMAMNERIQSDDLDLVITVVMIQRQIGGNLAEIFERIAETIRERQKLKGDIKALTAQGRLSGMVIGALPFFLLGAMWIINPEYTGLLFTFKTKGGAFKGWYLLVFGGILQVIGMYIIFKITDIEI